ncbi:MAG TPA: hypothetical protein VFV67_35595 [Actinophytocola sp.]|uniref:hypothetical protein n=1 Tax=Actinophytocola sp. TaxID=1872138 RepID=UPI002DBFA3A7|nr:hypothetical protein [Actinophytocola sp.]HEU5475981.1 hypothetical protein [Actinophytocola sp.]
MDALSEAAFGDRPDLAVTAVPADPRSRWLAAVVLGGQGRYAAAATLLDGLRGAADPVLAALAASTLASHRRQLGGHGAARLLDAAALHRLAAAPAAVPAQAWSDVLLGLAADALGHGRFTEADRLLSRARALGDPGWRGAIRLAWVSAEVALGRGRPGAAVPHAETAAGLAGAAGSVRHRIKSALVLGAALATRSDPGDRKRANGLLADARLAATDLGLLPLVWPCALLLAGLEPSAAVVHRRHAADALHTVLRRADPIGRRLAASSPWVPDLCALTG